MPSFSPELSIGCERQPNRFRLRCMEAIKGAKFVAFGSSSPSKFFAFRPVITMAVLTTVLFFLAFASLTPSRVNMFPAFGIAGKSVPAPHLGLHSEMRGSSSENSNDGSERARREVVEELTNSSKPLVEKGPGGTIPTLYDVNVPNLRQIPRPSGKPSVGGVQRHPNNGSHARRCKRKSHIGVIKQDLEGCTPVEVDVGRCEGSCPTKRPFSTAAQYRESDNTYYFETTNRCRCCQPHRNTTLVPTECSLTGDDGSVQTVSGHVRVEVIVSCHCRRCSAARKG